MNPLVLQVVGQPGSGKSEVCKFLADKYNFTTVLISDLIRNYAVQAGLDLKERRDYKPAHLQMLRELGNFAVVETILATPSSRLLVDGMRVPAHSAKLHQYGPIIALHCPAELRFARTLKRGNTLDKPNFEDFLIDEAMESRNVDPFVQSTLTVMETADYIIDTSKAKPLVLDEVSAVVEPLISDK